MASVLVALQAFFLSVMGLLLGALSVRVYRNRSSPGTVWFAGILATLSVGLLFVVGVGLAAGFDEQSRWLSVLYAVVLLTPAQWIAFVAGFTGRAEFLTRRRLAALTAPLLVGVLVVFSPAVTGGGGPLFLFSILVVFFYAVMLVFVGAALLIRTTYLYSHLSVSQGVAPSVALIEPWFVLTVVFQPIELSLPLRMGFVTAGVGLVTVLLAASVLRLGLLETAAAAGNIGREAVVDVIDEVVIVVNEDGLIVEANDAVETDLGVDRSAALGAPLESVVGRDLDALAADRSIDLYGASGYRTFEVGVSSLTDQHDRAFGRVITLSDVTRREIRQGQLAVLNRVLRHNLRNKMDVVHALADTIETPPDVSERIKEVADDLLETSERAREIERSMDASTVDVTRVRIADLVESTVRDVRERYPDACIETDVPADLTIRSDRAILGNVLSNLVENAAEHGDANAPWVSVTGRREAAAERPTVTIAVEDDGPGISDHERAVIEAGEESPLQHGSGLGLWAARWGTRILGGQLAFDTDRPEGTTVRVSLPVESPPDEGEAASGG